MSLGKKDIVSNISTKAFLSKKESKLLLEHFLLVIKKKSHQQQIKISKFGTFSFKKTPARVGRNPKTKEEYDIKPRKKLVLKPSNKIRMFIN
tara:strand:+ start:635 stop:910 length:276 start_codon:yes stop_codon:yes gene_type:complete